MSKHVQNATINPDPNSIVIKSNPTFYLALATRMKEGSRVFIPDMSRQSASYARKRLTVLVGEDVLGYPVQVSGKDGYLFHIHRPPKE
jgi:hypothetical protein